jgi:hypothetical protein
MAAPRGRNLAEREARSKILPHAPLAGLLLLFLPAVYLEGPRRPNAVDYENH